MNAFLLVLLSLLWGSSFLWTKLLLASFHPVSLVFFRCLFGVLFLIPFLIKKREKRAEKVNGTFLLTFSLGATIPWIILSFALLDLPTSVGGVLNSFTSIFTVLFAILYLKARPMKHQLIGLFLGILALVVIFIKSLSASEFTFYSVCFMLFVTWCYAANSILVTKHYKSISPFHLGFYTLFLSTTVTGIATLFIQPDAFSHLLRPEIIGILFVFGGISSGLGYVIYYQLISTGGPIYGTFVTLLIPVFAVIIGAGILNEAIYLNTILGILFMLVSLVAMNWRIVGKHRGGSCGD